MVEEEKENNRGGGGTMRGSASAAKERRTLKMTSLQNQEAGENRSIPLYGKLTLVIVAVVLLQLFARRKKSKHAEKSV